MTEGAKVLIQLPLMIGIIAAWDVPSITTWQFWIGITCLAIFVTVEKA